MSEHENDTTYSFEIKEDFETIAKRIKKSIKDGLISEFAERGYDALGNCYWRDFNKNIEYSDIDCLQIEKTDNSITFRHKNTDKDWEEKFQEIIVDEENKSIEMTYYYSDDYYGYSDNVENLTAVIRLDKNGKCKYSGNFLPSFDEDSNLRILGSIRNEITYVPGSLEIRYPDGHVEKADEENLLEQEKHKITSKQDMKNYLAQVGFDQGKKISYDWYDKKIIQLIQTIQENPIKPLDYERRDVYYNYSFGGPCGESYDIYDGKYPENSYKGTLEDNNGGYTSWGNEISVPAHWSDNDVFDFLGANKKYGISERLYDSYIKSSDNFESFIISLSKQVLKNKKKGMSREENLDAALTLIDAKNRVRQSLRQNEAIHDNVKEGIAKTKENGYKHISRTPKEGVKTPAWMRKRQREQGGMGE